jgi:L-fuconolactonase
MGNGALVVDAHQHFWDPARATYAWLTDELDPIRRAFGPADLEPELRRRGIDRTILVQTRSSIEETLEFLALADSHAFAAGVVGWVDLTASDVAGVLASLRRERGGERLVGIRHQVHDEANPRWLLRDDVQRGLAAVGDAGLAYELLVRPRELPAALETVRRHPDMRFVIDHLGKPRIRDGADDPSWARWLPRFAPYENVRCKLSGLVTEADWTGWTIDGLRVYVRRALEWFGEDRLVFGSDWPVCLLAGSYERVVDAYRDAVGPVSPTAQTRIFGLNAIEFYGLQH